MKAIIDNKLYDTTTAAVVYSSGNECLFRTANGTYFRTSHIGIEPMANESVKEYLGIADADSYIKEFGEVEEA